MFFCQDQDQSFSLLFPWCLFTIRKRQIGSNWYKLSIGSRYMQPKDPAATFFPTFLHRSHRRFSECNGAWGTAQSNGCDLSRLPPAAGPLAEEPEAIVTAGITEKVSGKLQGILHTSYKPPIGTPSFDWFWKDTSTSNSSLNPRYSGFRQRVIMLS